MAFITEQEVEKKMEYLREILILIIISILALVVSKMEQRWQKLFLLLSEPLFFIISGLLLLAIFTKWGIDRPGEIFYVIGLFLFFLACGSFMSYSRLKRKGT